MREKHCERIPSGIAMSTQLIKRGQALVGVLVSGLGITPPYRLGLRLHMPCKLRDKLFKFCHGQIPFLTFSMASKPNSRCAS
ncbi:hypothetical protein [Archangium sp.]|uniref:hypothetical protein n=1 Tax=Archangium sp. TaxID=1872627 RepID=UPI002D56CB1D|nr:hypothetical protein [Archangium sp.]HYO54307.1 hypothetical protein [Archangium sp.]